MFSKIEPMQSATQSYRDMPPSHCNTLQECLSQSATNQVKYCKPLGNLHFLFSNAAESDSFRGTEYQPTATWEWIQLSILTTLSTCAKAFKLQEILWIPVWGLLVQELPQPTAYLSFLQVDYLFCCFKFFHIYTFPSEIPKQL